MRGWIFIPLIGLAIVAGISQLASGEFPWLSRLVPKNRYGQARPQRECDRCNLDPYSRLHYAGHPETIAWWAKPSKTPHYAGYYVGGSAPFYGRPRAIHEGVWGWDYVGGYFRRHVNLNWLSRRHRRDEVSGYKTEGPRIFGE